MISLKQFVARSVPLVSLAVASPALADTTYENNAGQSAQMTQTMQHQTEKVISSSDIENSKTFISGALGTKSVESFRQSNTLGQSDAMSKTRPYVSLNKSLEVTFKGRSKVKDSSYSDDNKRVGRPLDW